MDRPDERAPTDICRLAGDLTEALRTLLTGASPAERTAFVLSRGFDLGCAEIAAVVAASADECRTMECGVERRLHQCIRRSLMPDANQRTRVMTNRKIIAVVGATGAQGGALARAILADPAREFAARALTRNPASEKARALAELGAEVVPADLDDTESLVRAFAGAHGAFGVTNFWEHHSPEREKQQARNLAEAAARGGLQHVIWSTLEDTRERVPLTDDRMPTLMGSYKVPHFDAKGESDRWFRALGVPTTFLRTSFYWENFIDSGLGPKRGEDGVLTLTLPMGDGRLAGIATRDIGRCAHAVFRRGPSLLGTTVGIAGGHLTGSEMAEQLGKALGEEVRYQDVPPDTIRQLGFPGAEDMANMFQYYQEFEAECCASRPIDGSRRLNPELLSFDQWLDENASRIPLEARVG